MDSSPEQNVYNVHPNDYAKKNKTNTSLHFNVILLGKIGDGKSATGNTILGKKAFESKRSFNSTTQEVQMERVIYDGVTLDVYDTPGLFGPDRINGNNKEKGKPFHQLDPSVPLVFLLVMKADRFTPEEKKTVELIERMVPDWLLQNTWILFTRGDELESEGLSVEEFIEETEELKRVIQRFNNRYHIFNNRTHNPDQVKQLIEKIRNSPRNMERLPQRTPVHPEKDPTERRIVLLGKTGAGKSAAGNTILGETSFRSQFSLSSVTAQCEREEAVVAGRRVCVVDTPGLFDTEMSPEDLAVEIGRSVYLSSPGPHAFLYVQPINNRFTKQEEEVVGKLEQMFGEEIRKYTIILFTHGDQLEGESVENLIKNSKSVSTMVDQCGGYHVFNNKDLENRQQVTDLLEKIDRMLKKNGGSCYSNKMFEDAERCRMEEEETVKRKKVEQKLREEEQRQEEIEKIEKETEERVRGEMIKENILKKMNEDTEKKIRKEVNNETQKKIKKEMENIDIEIEKTITEKFNTFLERNKTQLWTAGLVGAGYGAVSGFFLGLFGGACVGGVVGAVAGGVVGAAAGACVGAGVGRWNYKKKEKLRLRKELDCEKNTRYEELEKKIEKEKETKIAEEMNRQKPEIEEQMAEKVERQKQERYEQMRKELEREKKRREDEIVRKLEKMRVESEKIISEEMEKRKKAREKRIKEEMEK